MNRIIYDDVTDLVWANAEHTSINCMVSFVDHPILGTSVHPFSASKFDSEPQALEIFELATQTDEALGQIAPYISPIEVPQSLTPLQARRALRAAGLKEAVDSYVLTLSDEAKEEWEFALSIERNNPVIVQGLIALGKTEKDGDDLFILGATL